MPNGIPDMLGELRVDDRAINLPDDAYLPSVFPKSANFNHYRTGRKPACSEPLCHGHLVHPIVRLGNELIASQRYQESFHRGNRQWKIVFFQHHPLDQSFLKIIADVLKITILSEINEFRGILYEIIHFKDRPCG